MRVWTLFTVASLFTLVPTVVEAAGSSGAGADVAPRSLTMVTESRDSVTARWGQVIRQAELVTSGEELAATLSRGVSFIEQGDGAPGPQRGDSEVSLGLPDGSSVTALSEVVSLSVYPLVEADGTELQGESLLWTGRTDTGGTVTLGLFRNSTIDRWQLSGGTVETAEQVFLIRRDGDKVDGPMMIRDRYNDPDAPEDVDDAIASGLTPVEPYVDPDQGESGGEAPVLSSAAPAPGMVIRVMGVAFADVSLAAAQTYLTTSLAETQTTLANSSATSHQTAATVQLAQVNATNFQQTSNITNDVINSLAGSQGQLSNVAAWRIAAGADFVVGVAPDRYGSTCGASQYPGAFSVVVIETNPDCADRHAVTHELGHGMGASHDDVGSGITGYGTARAHWTSSTRCTMVHTGLGCRRLVYSTPERNYPGSSTAAGNATRHNSRAVSDWMVYAACFNGAAGFGGAYTRLSSPVRILDSRPASTIGGYRKPIEPNEVWSVRVPTSTGVPANARAVVVNITAVNPTNTAHLEAFECGNGFTHTTVGATVNTAGTSMLNYRSGRSRAQTVIVSMGEYDYFSLRGAGRTDVVVDVIGYFGGSTNSTSGEIHPLGNLPIRVVDTRSSNNALRQGGLQAGARTYNVTLASPPAGVRAAIANITVVNPAAAGHLTVAATQNEAASATGSTLNYHHGIAEHNTTIIPLTTSGGVSRFGLYTLNSAEVVVDILGWVGTNGTLEYTNCPATPPARLWDDPQAFNHHRTLNPGGGVDAAWLNVTVVNPPFAGHVVAKPGTNAGTWPDISIANHVVGSVTNNHGFLHTSGGQFSFLPVSPGQSGTFRFIIDREACFT